MDFKKIVKPNIQKLNRIKDTFDDRFDGEFWISNYWGLGGYFFTPLSENMKTFLLHQIGIITFNESFYNKYYDSFEILGNNGKYYSESSTPDKSSFGFEFGTNFYFSLSQHLFEYY